MKPMHLLSMAAVLLLLGCGGSSTPQVAGPPPSGGTWVLSWSDEFNGADGSAPDPTKWTYDLGAGGWGNGELESYTNRSQNVVVQGGNLVITALKENYTGGDGIPSSYTSARLKTQGLFSQSSGRFEARIKIPSGRGIWPAFWLLGTDISSNGWPTCGEIDIMESIGSQPSWIYGTIHGPGYSGASGLSTGSQLGTGTYADAFHTYAVEWEGTQIRFYVDNFLYVTRTPADLPKNGALWVFDHPFFILLNVAVGGNWPGSPDSSTVFPQQMLVDYVRVYRRS
ncbi:glycoside hydrolase family 16 protein [Geothrix sp. SG200]|uniref:glycoside hydrolase family 16 protein n=1 Tax=Geothrix sp. SG200 TaxID=2922865 RepID=UPI001FAE2130|nr:glycoside hydrolase family 16 protein [Geothrix sp. SG200]